MRLIIGSSSGLERKATNVIVMHTAALPTGQRLPLRTSSLEEALLSLRMRRATQRLSLLARARALDACIAIHYSCTKVVPWYDLSTTFRKALLYMHMYMHMYM